MTELTPEKRARVIAMYREGRKTAEITAETGVARSTIYFILSEEGIAASRRPRRTAARKAIDQVKSEPEYASLLNRTLSRLEEQQVQIDNLRGVLRTVVTLIDEQTQGLATLARHISDQLGEPPD